MGLPRGNCGDPSLGLLRRLLGLPTGGLPTLVVKSLSGRGKDPSLGGGLLGPRIKSLRGRGKEPSLELELLAICGGLLTRVKSLRGRGNELGLKLGLPTRMNASGGLFAGKELLLPRLPGLILIRISCGLLRWLYGCASFGLGLMGIAALLRGLSIGTTTFSTKKE